MQNVTTHFLKLIGPTWLWLTLQIKYNIISIKDFKICCFFYVADRLERIREKGR